MNASRSPYWLIRWAEENGITDGWLADAGAPDALTQAAAIAHHTREMRIGVAVTPVYTRTTAVVAATADTISQVLPGRFIMGLGSSSQTIMGGGQFYPWSKPRLAFFYTVQVTKCIIFTGK